MNNTKTLAIVAVLMAATLVVGTVATMATTQSAYAYAKKPRNDDNKRQEIMEVEIEMATQLPHSNAKIKVLQVDLIQQ